MKQNIFHIIMWRRACAATLQLNYVDQDTANAVFDRLSSLKSKEHFDDDYGVRMTIDPADVAHVVFVDAAKSAEMQVDAQMVLQTTAQRLGLKQQQEAYVANFNGTVPMIMVGTPENQTPN